jgi:hypothetical protein
MAFSCNLAFCIWQGGVFGALWRKGNEGLVGRGDDGVGCDRDSIRRWQASRVSEGRR